jgi:hypothetical protein
MNTFLKYFWKDESIFVSEKDPDDLKKEMMELFNAKYGWPYKSELAGYFKNNNFYIAQKRFSVFSLESTGYRWNDYFLEGNIIENKSRGSLITFHIKPEFQLLLFSIILVVLTIVGYCYFFPLDSIFGVLIYIIIMALIYFINWSKKDALRQKTIKAFQLIPFRERYKYPIIFSQPTPTTAM